MVGLPCRQVTGAGLANRWAVEAVVLVAVVDAEHDPAVRAGGVVPVVEASCTERIQPIKKVVPTGWVGGVSTD